MASTDDPAFAPWSFSVSAFPFAWYSCCFLSFLPSVPQSFQHPPILVPLPFTFKDNSFGCSAVAEVKTLLLIDPSIRKHVMRIAWQSYIIIFGRKNTNIDGHQVCCIIINELYFDGSDVLVFSRHCLLAWAHILVWYSRCFLFYPPLLRCASLESVVCGPVGCGQCFFSETTIRLKCGA